MLRTIKLISGKVFNFHGSFPFSYTHKKGPPPYDGYAKCNLCSKIIHLRNDCPDWFYEDKEYKHLIRYHKDWFLEMMLAGVIEYGVEL